MKRWLILRYIKSSVPDMLDYLKNFAKGYGTTAVGIAMIVHGISGFITEDCVYDACVKEILEGIGLLTLRRALAGKP